MPVMIAGQCYADGWHLTVVPIAGADVVVAIPNGTYYLLGDGTAVDLLHAVNTALAGAGFAGVVFSLLASGFVRITIAGVTGLKDFTLAFRRTLGFRIDISPIASITADYRPLVTYVDGALAVEDLEEPEALVARAETDERVYTSVYGSRVRRNVQLYFTGFPRSSTPGEEYYGLRGLFDEVLAQGRQFRYYPDTSVTTLAYLPTLPATRPWGYQVYTHDSPQVFNAAPRVPNWYQHWALACSWRAEEESL